MFQNVYLWLLIAGVLLLSIQILAVVIYIFSFIPLVWDDTFLTGLEPTRDTLFYALFIAITVILTVIGVLGVLPRLNSPENRRKFKFWLCLEAIWSFLILFCFLKWITYRYPFWNVLAYENKGWLLPFFWVVGGMSVLSKVFFAEIENFYCYLQRFGKMWESPPAYRIVCQIIFWVAVGMLLYIPKPQDVVALALVWDQWNHLDAVAGWFIKHGWYLSYEAVIQVLVALAVMYSISLFYFIHRWLQNWFLSTIGVLLVIKMGMFYYGSVPCIWTNPANTFLAHGWDIFLFWGLWFVSQKYRTNFYLIASVTGSMLVLLWFRSNGHLQALGLDNQPMYAPLRVRQFFPFFMGYFVPLFYVFGLLLMMGIKNAQNALELRLPIVLSIYGLMIFIDYLEHPMIGFYGSLMVPAILIFLWWTKQLLSPFSKFFKRMAYAASLIMITGALLTNRLMLTYPNSFFEDKDRFASESKFYQQFRVIAQSAALISKLTTEGQKVVLLSNFETALLMQAHREPLFTDFPVMFSGLQNPGGLNLKTKKQGLDLINSMEEENAQYVFVDERLLALTPESLNNTGLNAVLAFVKDHYTNYTRQGFLVAMQRK